MKLNKYKTFEEYKDENQVGPNYDKKIEEVLSALVKQKLLISMLSDTINHVSQIIESIFPEHTEEFMEALNDYDDYIYKKVDEIRESLINGYPNVKDMIEDIELDFSDIEKYLKNK